MPTWWERINLNGKIVFFANCNGLVKHELYNFFQRSNVSAVVGYDREINTLRKGDDILDFVLKPIFKSKKKIDLYTAVKKAEKQSQGLTIIKGKNIFL